MSRKLTFLGRKIKKARKEAGLSQRQLGDSLRVSDKAVSSYEIGRTKPNIDVLQKISKVVHKPFSYFDSQTPEHEADLEAKIFRIEEELQEVKKLLQKRKNN